MARMTETPTGARDCYRYPRLDRTTRAQLSNFACDLTIITRAGQGSMRLTPQIIVITGTDDAPSSRVPVRGTHRLIVKRFTSEGATTIFGSREFLYSLEFRRPNRNGQHRPSGWFIPTGRRRWRGRCEGLRVYCAKRYLLELPSVPNSNSTNHRNRQPSGTGFF